MKKIGIIDDHRIVRDGIRAMLLGNGEYQIAVEAGDREEFIRKCNGVYPDIVILDLKLKNESGVEVLQWIKASLLGTQVVMISGEWDSYNLKAALFADADGLLSKESGRMVFIGALDEVSKGEKFFDPVLSTMMMAKNIKPDVRAILSDRELEVMKGFARGLSYKEMAAELFISVRTVESHKINILRKLNLDTTVDMIRMAIDQKLL